MVAINEFLIVLLTAIVMHNAVITRGFGFGKQMLRLSSTRKILLYGAALTTVCVLSSLLAWPLWNLLRTIPASAGQSIPFYFATLGSICVVYFSIWLLTKYQFPRLHYLLRALLSSAAFSCAVLGSLLIAFSASYSLLSTIGFALGSGIGYTLAILLLYEGRRRIALSDLPRPFRGLPILLLYLGILSMAIYGLVGHQLPT